MLPSLQAHRGILRATAISTQMSRVKMSKIQNKLNPQVLLALGFLKNPKSVSEEELGKSWKDGRLAYDNATSSCNVAAQMYCDYDCIANVEEGDCDAAYQYAIKILDEYFKDFEEDKQNYIDELERAK